MERKHQKNRFGGKKWETDERIELLMYTGTNEYCAKCMAKKMDK